LPAALSTRESELLLLKLRDWRNQKTEEKGLPPVAVFSNNLLKSLTRLAPETLAELEAVPEIRRWQVAEFGEEVLALIAEVQSRRESEGSGKKRRRRRRSEPARDAENS
ncbi:MAG TPA: HRDC domain-containing protein, partial [Myxococcota bacterium]|nr:HRDC domain-containing protein [Myxococcota bacterium]